MKLKKYKIDFISVLFSLGVLGVVCSLGVSITQTVLKKQALQQQEIENQDRPKPAF